MSADELNRIFSIERMAQTGSGGHGFGLLNCRGIIEKYKKVSQIFSVCTIGAESKEGIGSRFFFRLPKGMRRALLLIVVLASGAGFGGIPPFSSFVFSIFLLLPLPLTVCSSSVSFLPGFFQSAKYE